MGWFYLVFGHEIANGSRIKLVLVLWERNRSKDPISAKNMELFVFVVDLLEEE